MANRLLSCHGPLAISILLALVLISAVQAESDHDNDHSLNTSPDGFSTHPSNSLTDLSSGSPALLETQSRFLAEKSSRRRRQRSARRRRCRKRSPPRSPRRPPSHRPPPSPPRRKSPPPKMPTTYRRPPPKKKSAPRPLPPVYKKRSPPRSPPPRRKSPPPKKKSPPLPPVYNKRSPPRSPPPRRKSPPPTIVYKRPPPKKKSPASSPPPVYRAPPRSPPPRAPGNYTWPGRPMGDALEGYAQTTYYNWGGGGACGVGRYYPEYTAALSSTLYRGSFGCGLCYLLECIGSRYGPACTGRSIIIRATDLCPDQGNPICVNGPHFDLNRAAFAALGNMRVGVLQVKYTKVACPKSPTNEITVMSLGGHNYYLGLSFPDSNERVMSLEYSSADGTPGWHKASDGWGGTFSFGGKVIKGKLSLRLTGESGKIITLLNCLEENQWRVKDFAKKVPGNF